MSSIDYKLPGFQPLTYMGQKELCEMLDLKLINSRNEIVVQISDHIFNNYPGNL